MKNNHSSVNSKKEKTSTVIIRRIPIKEGCGASLSRPFATRMVGWMQASRHEWIYSANGQACLTPN